VKAAVAEAYTPSVFRMGYADRDFREIRLLAPPYARTILIWSTRYTPCRWGVAARPSTIWSGSTDSLRALLSIGVERPEFTSRKANAFTRFSNLALLTDRELHAHAVLDGEVVCFDGKGRPRVNELMFGRAARSVLGQPSGPSLDEVGAI
jgi:hypothetical protein